MKLCIFTLVMNSIFVHTKQEVECLDFRHGYSYTNPIIKYSNSKTEQEIAYKCQKNKIQTFFDTENKLFDIRVEDVSLGL